MPYETRLTREETNRMVYVTLNCTDPKCLAVRGERCRSLVHTQRNDGFTMIPHVWRRLGFTTWKKAHPEKYQWLVRQVLAERCDEVATYETMPG